MGTSPSSPRAMGCRTKQAPPWSPARAEYSAVSKCGADRDERAESDRHQPQFSRPMLGPVHKLCASVCQEHCRKS